MAKSTKTIPETENAAPAGHVTRKPMQVIFRLLSERKGLFIANLGLRMVKDLLPFANPILVGVAVDVLSGTDKTLLGYSFKAADLRSIYTIAGLMAALAVAKMVFGYVNTIVAAHLGRHVVEAARRDLAEASMHMALDERRRFNSGDLLDRSLADTKGLRSFTQNVIIRIISNTVRAIWPLVFMFRLDWAMALVVLAVIPLQSGISWILQQRLQRLTREARAAESQHTSSVKESIDGWSSVASVGGQDWVTSELRHTAAISEDAKIKKKHTTAAISAVISLFTALGIAACYAIGGWRIITSGLVGVTGDTGGFTLGDLIAFVGVAKKTYAPFQAYTKIVSSYRTGLVNLERIAEVLDAPKIDPRRNGPELIVTTGNVQLAQVGFTYDKADSPTLKSLTGTIPGRTLTVITGSSGAGKTTLLRLLLGIDQPHQGSISIDDQDINVARLASVQRVMALVPQEPMLFTGTLGENLMLGHDDATTEDLLDVCHKAGLLDLVRELPGGLDTEVGSGKHMLSGGQLRRMAIARALLRKPAILLLDEPTTGLDDLNSKQVLDTLRHIAQAATVIMVSHRRDPLAASDHHLILEAGSWRDGDGSVDRWRPESTGTLTEPEADPVLDHSVEQTNNTPQRTIAARSVTIGDSVLELSAMGRPIRLNYVNKDESAARVLIVGGHRSNAAVDHTVVDRVMTRAAADAQSHVAVAAIPDLNPDGAHRSDRRTVLGVDIANDHRQRLAGETKVFHRAIADWDSQVIIDIGERTSAQRSNADVDVTIRFVPEVHDNAPEWLAHVGSDIRRRLKTSRFSVAVSLVQAESSSLAATTGVPVVEVTAVSAPHMAGSERSTESLVEAASAAFQATGLLRVADEPALA